MMQLNKSNEKFAVVLTQPHKEDAVIEHLLRQGYKPYCPKIVKRVVHARRSREVLRPLFPCYVFVSVDLSNQEWLPIRSTFGVRSVVRAGDRPALLDGAFICALRAREMDGSIILPPNPYKVGEEVRFIGTAFDGVVAQIVELKDADRVVVMLQLLHRSTLITTNVRAVRPSEMPD
jgi:transcriptional antiterminator RfaH